MTDIDTSAEAVERLAREYDEMAAENYAAGVAFQEMGDLFRSRAATLRALVRERDEARAALSAEALDNVRLRDRLSSEWQAGAEAMREKAATEMLWIKRGWVAHMMVCFDEAAKTIRALPIPERPE